MESIQDKRRKKWRKVGWSTGLRHEGARIQRRLADLAIRRSIAICLITIFQAFYVVLVDAEETKVAYLTIDVSTAHPSSPQTLPAEVVLRDGNVRPESFRSFSDGTDDAPAIQRAVNSICFQGLVARLQFAARHYSLRTPVVQRCQIEWVGQGWQEVTSNQNVPLTGTWLDIATSAFGVSGSNNPILFSGAAASGSAVSGIGVTAPFQPPHHDEQTWSPPDFPPIFYADKLKGGMSFRHIMCRGVNKCIAISESGRTNFDDIRGQVWRELVNIELNFDVTRGDGLHVWPFLTTDPRVIRFQQSHAVAVHSWRNDTPLFGRIFAFGSMAGIEIDADHGGGTTTGASIDSLSCDFTRHCLYISENAAGAQIQIGRIRSYAEDWGSHPPTMLAGSDVIHVAGPSAIIQIGSLEDVGSDSAIIRLPNRSGASNVQIASLYGVLTRMQPNSVLAFMASNQPHVVTLGMPPMLTPDAPPNWRITNPEAGGSVSWPQATPQR